MTRLDVAGLRVARNRRSLLQDIDARFAGGEMIAILGANGVGKTSLLLTLAGLLKPAGGTIRVDGVPLATLTARERAKRIAFVETAEPVSGRLTVEEAAFGARFPYQRWYDWGPTGADIAAVDSALARVNLDALRRRELRTLSAGECQRVWLGIALAQRADILFFDEPTSHLDLRYAVETLELMRTLAQAGALVIAVLHALEEAASFCDRILMLAEQTVIADGPPAQTLTTALIERAYGVNVEVESRGPELLFARRRRFDENRRS